MAVVTARATGAQIQLSTGSGLALLQQDCSNGFPPKIGTKMGFNPTAAPAKHRESFLPQEGKRGTGDSRICARIQQWFEVLG